MTTPPHRRALDRRIVAGAVAVYALALVVVMLSFLRPLTWPEQRTVLAGIAVWAAVSVGVRIIGSVIRADRTATISTATIGTVVDSTAVDSRPVPASGPAVRAGTPGSSRTNSPFVDGLARIIHAFIADRPGCETVDPAAAVCAAATRWPSDFGVHGNELHELIGGTAPVSQHTLVDELITLPHLPHQDVYADATRRRCAAHEAGHAVVAAVTGLEFFGATLLPGADEDDGKDGGTCFHANPEPITGRAETVALIAFDLAGIEAERLLLGEISDGGHRDALEADERARRLARCDGTDTTQTLLAEGRTLAVRTLHQHGDALQAAAEHLQEHQRLGTTTLTGLISDHTADHVTDHVADRASHPAELAVRP